MIEGSISREIGARAPTKQSLSRVQHLSFFQHLYFHPSQFSSSTTLIITIYLLIHLFCLDFLDFLLTISARRTTTKIDLRDQLHLEQQT
ncbi:hypothetical protein EYC80_006939 [Monilinia laxa]|uniref:Uncharacterized protein n=1 Tax=Monilinia laxa TaxID=61186 RepID=A0A5N6JZP1_MONLA|nr:hypothetical protein EYC80_006939 [Monilinia laxa]